MDLLPYLLLVLILNCVTVRAIWRLRADPALAPLFAHQHQPDQTDHPDLDSDEDLKL